MSKLRYISRSSQLVLSEALDVPRQPTGPFPLCPTRQSATCLGGLSLAICSAISINALEPEPVVDAGTGGDRIRWAPAMITLLGSPPATRRTGRRRRGDPADVGEEPHLEAGVLDSVDTKGVGHVHRRDVSRVAVAERDRRDAVADRERRCCPG